MQQLSKQVSVRGALVPDNMQGSGHFFEDTAGMNNTLDGRLRLEGGCPLHCQSAIGAPHYPLSTGLSSAVHPLLPVFNAAGFGCISSWRTCSETVARKSSTLNLVISSGTVRSSCALLHAVHNWSWRESLCAAGSGVAGIPNCRQPCVRAGKAWAPKAQSAKPYDYEPPLQPPQRHVSYAASPQLCRTELSTPCQGPAVLVLPRCPAMCVVPLRNPRAGFLSPAEPRWQ